MGRYVLAGKVKDALCNKVLTKIRKEMMIAEADLEYDIYPLGMSVTWAA